MRYGCPGNGEADIRPRPTREETKRPPSRAGVTKSYATKDGRHPAFGALKDMIQIAPGVDLTEPTFPDFEKDWLEANAWWLDDPKLNPKR